VQKSALLAAIQKEIHRHNFSYFVDEPPSIAEGGRGVVVAGCPGCLEENQNDAGLLRPSREGCHAESD